MTPVLLTRDPYNGEEQNEALNKISYPRVIYKQ